MRTKWQMLISQSIVPASITKCLVPARKSYVETGRSAVVVAEASHYLFL